MFANNNTRRHSADKFKFLAIYEEPNEIDLDSVKICDDLRLPLCQKENVDNELIKLWQSLVIRPKIIVFDLDLTLWPFWVDTHVSPPFRKVTNSSADGKSMILDSENRKMTFYKDVPIILNTLKNHCLKENGYMAIASRTNDSKGALELMELYGWKDYFNSFQMYSGTKIVHINKICEELNISNKKEILFFDDKLYNIKDVKSLGVTGHLLDQRYGLTKDDCLKGLKMHENKKN